MSPSETVTLKIIPDSGPLRSFIKLLQCALKICKTPIDLPYFPSELVRIETDKSSTRAGVLRVTLYPSDCFLRYAATVFAGKLDLDTIKDIGHE